MKAVKSNYAGRVEIEVYLSKMADIVTKMYNLQSELREEFKVMVERDANTPFITSRLQLGVFDFLLIAPTTSNTVAKLAYGISDRRSRYLS